jgi:hypothetical protein
MGKQNDLDGGQQLMLRKPKALRGPADAGLETMQ